MLGLQGMVFFRLIELINHLDLAVGYVCIAAINSSFGSHELLIYFFQCAFDVAALGVEDASIGILEFDVVMVKDFSIIFSFAHFPTSHALGFYGVVALKPLDHVHVVDV